MATYNDYVGLTARVTRTAAPAVASLQTGGEAAASARRTFSVQTAGRDPSVAATAAVSSSRPAAYLPYSGMAMTPSDIMRQQICYQGIVSLRIVMLVRLNSENFHSASEVTTYGAI